MEKFVFSWFCWSVFTCICTNSSTTNPFQKDLCQEGSMQSPIDIITKTAEETELPPLRFTNHWDSELESFMIQVGDSVIIKPNADIFPSLEGGPLTGEFLLDQLNFHWSSGNENGTEHSIDGCKFAMEAHLVYYNSFYETPDRAENQPDGIAVVAVLMESKATYHSSPLESVVTSLSKMNRSGQSVNLTKNMFKMFRELFESQEYYTYLGSLTTPPCSEQVVWLVFKNKLHIHLSQVSSFRNVKNEGDKIVCNVRDIQPLNERTIYVISGGCPCPDEVCKKKSKKL